MDKDTFQNAEVAKYMANNFYMVKLDGEGKEPIDFKGKTYKYVPSGKRGYHELAAASNARAVKLPDCGLHG